MVVNPSVIWEAPPEDPDVSDSGGNVELRCTAAHNMIGLPAISVPCGFGPAGLPLGFQIAGPPMAEALVLRVAHAYEQRSGWPLRPPL